MAQERTFEQVAGVVTCSNPKGFQVAGRDGWLNISRFAVGIEAPAKGTQVAAGLDRAGFVRTITTDTPAEIAPAAATKTPDHSTIVDSSTGSAHTSGNPTKDQQIARMNALGHAISILQASPAYTVEGVLTVAEILESWVLR